jgi:hypothetical protein
MRKLVAVCALCLLSGLGCIDALHLREEAPKKNPSPTTPLTRPPQVRPETITLSNAHAKAQELAAELDFDSQSGGKTP